MAKVTDILTSIKKRAAVDAVVLTTDDGLALDSVAEPEVDTEMIAAYAASYASSSMRMGEESQYGAMDAIIVVYQGHAVVVAPVDKSVVLAAIGTGGSQLGKMHMYIQRIRPDLAAALREEQLASLTPMADGELQTQHSNGASEPTPKPEPANIA